MSAATDAALTVSVNPMTNVVPSSGVSPGAAAGASFWTTKAIMVAAGSVVFAGALIGGLVGGLTAKKDAAATTSGGPSGDSGENDLLRGGDESARSWTRVFTLYHNSVRDLACSSDGSLVLASSYNAESEAAFVMLSSNRGESWTNLFEDRDGEYPSAMPPSGRCIVVGRDDSVFVLSDDGSGRRRFTENRPAELEGKGSIQSVAVSHDCQTVVVAMTADDESVWVSEDGGKSFTRSDIVTDEFKKVSCDATCDTIVIVTETGRMYLSVDRGKTIPRVRTGPDDDFEEDNPEWNEACLSSDGETILAVSGSMLDHHYRYLSTSRGQSWTKIESGPDDGEQHWLSCAMSADGSTMIAGNGNSMHWSKDRGVSWTIDKPIDESYSFRLAYFGLACDATCETIYAQVVDFGIIRSE
jgi:photosystem II stability/assembly factor-like uncharacterized protein